jgi:phage baseplate assembly protein W
MAIIYRGMSTLVSEKKFSLTDYALAKRDLLNYFNIRKGDKLMNPGFGTIIWDMLFQPLTEEIQHAIGADVTRIVGYDPRLQVGQIAITTPQNSDGGGGINVQLTLSYVPTNYAETIRLQFDAQSNTLTTRSIY